MKSLLKIFSWQTLLAVVLDQLEYRGQTRHIIENLLAGKTGPILFDVTAAALDAVTRAQELADSGSEVGAATDKRIFARNILRSSYAFSPDRYPDRILNAAIELAVNHIKRNASSTKIP